MTSRPVPPRGDTSALSGPGSTDLAAVGRGSRLGLIGAGFSALANLALALVVTRGFGRHDAGLFFSVTAVFLVLEMLSRLGTDTASVYFIARLRALGEPHLINAHLRAAIKPVLAVTLACSAALAIFAGYLSRELLDGSSPLDLQVMAAFLPCAVAYDICLAATRGFGTVVAATVLEKLLRPGLQLVLLAVVAAVGSADQLAIAWALPYLIVLPMAVVVLVRLVRGENVPQRSADRDVFRPFWAFAAPRSVTGLAQALLQRLDIVIVAAILGPSEAAIYAAATRFLVLGQLGNQAISAPVEPRLSGLLARRDIAGSQDVYRLSTAWLICVNWPLFLVTAVYASTIMEAFGKGYHSGWTVAMLLCLCMLAATGVGLVDVVLVFAGRTTWNLFNTVTALAINIAIDVALLPHIGLIGAAVGWGGAILITNLLPLAQIHHLLGLHPFGKRVYTAVLVTVVSFGLVPGLTRLFLGDGFTSLVIAGLLGLCVYAALMHRFRGVLQLDLLLGRFMKHSPGARASKAPAAVASAPVAASTAVEPAPAGRGSRRRIGRHRWSD
ncbi:MAG TPA: oligosaccharide flippase family protein [Frankiaceae bacterium]|nr:oligosaccharide flippase family protein [Frankiaceae bacterium]